MEQKWAIIKYQTPDKDAQEKALITLAGQAAQTSKDYPGKAAPLIVQAIILCTKAGIEDDYGALDEIEEARDLLLQAEQINPRALNGSAASLLGWLYHKVPRWPIGFGDDRQAVKYFKIAMDLDPADIDTSFYYGNFLYEKGDYAQAKTVLERGLAAPINPATAVADKGRQDEIRNLLEKVNKKL
ncbi:MAG: hypothetical protein KGI37_10695 [Alphaproteobacteria bacterium]|nr:hypothetical protein [Alphaproteobacteria bacterium]